MTETDPNAVLRCGRARSIEKMNLRAASCLLAGTVATSHDLTFEVVRVHVALVTRMLKSHPGSADKLQPIRRVRAESSLGLGWRLEKMGRICLRVGLHAAA
jgi:hypothetical protein